MTLLAISLRGTITANLIGNVTGNVTGSASLNVLKAGDTMTGALTMPAGTAASPSIKFTGSTNTGISAATVNTLSFDTNGVERMNINATGGVTIDGFTTAGVVHNSAAGLLSSSLIVNADITPGTITNASLAAISSSNVANDIVVRDGSGNFAAGTITAALSGNATTATTATNFSGSLVGDVTGTQGATVVSTVGGQTAANVAAGAVLANAATNLDTVNTIVKRDASGNFSAGTITANLSGTATNFSGALTGDVTGTQGATVVSTVGGQTAANVAAGSVLANAATNANTASTIVKRDASGNFSAGTITATLSGNVTGSASLNVLKAGDTMTGILTHPAGTAAAPSIQFTGSTNTGISAATVNTLSFDTNGAERMNISATGGVTINGLTTTGIVHNSAAGLLSSSLIVNADITPATITSASIANATITNSNLATISSSNVAGDIVVRDGSGNFAAGTITAALNGNATTATTATTATNFSGSLVGDVTGTQGATVVSTVGGQTAANVATATVLANAATNANTASTIVKRDASGNFTAGTITAALIGNVTGNVTGSASLNVLKSGDTMTGILTHPAGTAAAPSIQFTGSTNTGISAATVNTLSFDTNGVERMNINATGGVTIDGLTTAGVVHNSAAGLLSTSLIVNADITPATITGASIASATVTNANLAAISSSNVANDIVVRDGSGNFAAGTITAALNGNATTATSATTATTATNFSGSLVGDVTGTQGATVVSTVGGQTAANIATATSLVSTATWANTANTLVLRDASGNFAASTVTANLIGNVTGNVTGSASLNVLKAGDTMTGTLTMPAGTAAAPSIQFTGSTNTGISAATVNTLSFDTNGVERMNINATGGVTIDGLTTAGVVHNSAAGLLSTSLIVNADITPATITSASIASATITNANLAAISSSNVANDIVVRDGSGNFAAGTITAALNGNATTATTATTATNFSGSLVGDVTGTQGATVVSTVGGQTAANVAAATVLANAATNANTASTIVKRDASGNFSAGTITAALIGNVTGNVTGSASLNVLKAGDTMTGTLTHPAGTAAAPSIQFTGSTNTGISAATVNTLSFDTNGAERMNISATGGVTINGLNSAGVVHTSAAGLLSTSLIVNADITSATITGASIASATITNANLAAISSSNVANDIVVRDGSGNFAAGTITAALNGNATTATTATTATNFSGSLVGDVTGTQGATVVSLVGGQTAANVAAATVLANAATNANTASTIVKRDASGNFTAGTITAALIGNVTGNVTGSASLNVLKAGDTMTGILTHPAGTAAAPSIQFTGSTNTGISAATVNQLSFDTNGAERMNISATGGVTINGLNSAGVVHTSAAGLLSTSLIVNADITPATITGASIATATITNANLAAISSSNVANDIVVRDGSGNFAAGTITAALNGNATTATSATTATTATNFSGSLVGDVTGTQGATVVSTVGGQTAANVAAGTVLANAATNLDTVSTIVLRDSSGNFSAGTITAALIGNVTGNVTGSASLNVLKAGDTMTGALTMPAGTAASPSIKFTGSTNTGISAATVNQLSFDINGTEEMNINSTAINMLAKLVTQNLFCEQSIQSVTITANAQSVTAAATTSILILKTTAARTGFAITFPASPTNGQYFTVLLGGTNSVAGSNVGGTGGATIVNGVTTLNTTTPSVTYFYYSTDNVWYRTL